MYDEEVNELDDLEQEGMVFNIQKYSVHDGPGIRTIAFLKGCGLRCKWCSNPESQSFNPDLAFNEGRCLSFDKCKHCLGACERKAISKGKNNKPEIDRSKCEGCSIPCADACPAQSLLIYGKKRTVGDVIHAIEQDSVFYSRSGGGLTISGGEPLLQYPFAVSLLRQARRHRLKTAVETCGFVPERNVREAAPYLTYALFDIKHMDSKIHEANTGKPNEMIHKNFKILAEEFPDLPILARTPVIPGFNDSKEAIEAIASFIKPYERVNYELLPYHRLGTQKYTFTGRIPPMGEVSLDDKVFYDVQKVAQDILGSRLHVATKQS